MMILEKDVLLQNSFSRVVSGHSNASEVAYASYLALIVIGRPGISIVGQLTESVSPRF